MTEIRGVPASPGIAIGKAYLYNDEEAPIPQYAIVAADIHLEMGRYREAVKKAVQELETLKENSPEDDPDGFLDTHILMLQDPDVESKVDLRLGKVLMNVEWVLMEVVGELISKLNTMSDAYFKERALDFKDVSRRVLNHLLDRSRPELADLKDPVILVGSNLMPSDAVAMNKRYVLGIALDGGGKTTHTAILARSFEIPAVLGAVTITKECRDGEVIIVDGYQGKIILDPTPEILAFYKKRQMSHQKEESRLLLLNSLPAESRDGKLILLKANIEIPEEVEAVLAHGADGIGLYRSEFLFLKDGAGVLEEVQYRAYRQVLEGLPGKPVTIRTLDLGGDKLADGMDQGPKEANPILGWRAIRYCLAHIPLFKTQIRALLRASIHGDLRIMFPMVSGTSELDQAFQIWDETKQDLRSEKIPFREDVSLGTMIEIPSAALVSDHLAKKADFFSIGTNDLIQYTLAVDRGNERIAGLYEPYHPAVLRLVKMIIDNAHLQGIPVGMCGEMAADPVAAMILLGLGLDEFSMSAVYIPRVKQIIRGLSFEESEDVALKVLEMKSSAEVENFVSSYLKGRFEDFGEE